MRGDIGSSDPLHMLHNQPPLLSEVTVAAITREPLTPALVTSLDLVASVVTALVTHLKCAKTKKVLIGSTNEGVVNNEGVVSKYTIFSKIRFKFLKGIYCRLFFNLIIL